MIIDDIKNMFRGWFIGDFEPSILKSKDFEVAILFHPKGEKWPKHFHKESVEINVLITGKMIINGELIYFLLKKMKLLTQNF